MSDIWIDRMGLQVPEMSAGEGRQLALQVADRLAGAQAVAGDVQLPSMTVELRRRASDARDMDALARQIVDEILRQLKRSS